MTIALPDDAVASLIEQAANRLEGQLNAGPIAYTAETLAAELGMSARAIRAAISRGELRAVKRAGRWIIAADAITEWASPPERSRSRSRRSESSSLRDALV